MQYILFYIVILVTNIIQGITGFAGTILAMPPSLMLVGYDTAKPILNVLGILAGVYVLMTQKKFVNGKELKKVVVVMAVGMIGGIFLKSLFQGNDKILFKLLGIIVIFLAIKGFIDLMKSKQPKDTLSYCVEKQKSSLKNYSLLIGAGVVHGMFVSGGPLLIGYLSKTIKDKVSFRATISTVWVILNTIILLDDIRGGLWTTELIKIQLISIPFLIAGMVIGTKLYKNMSQLLFMKITYLLLFISGISLFIK